MITFPSLESIDVTEYQGSHMIFTLHIYQYRIDKSGRGGGKDISFLVSFNHSIVCYKSLPKKQHYVIIAPCKMDNLLPATRDASLNDFCPS